MRVLSLALAALIAASGCSYSTRSNLPAHIRTVEVPLVKNRQTFYYGLEGRLSKALINRVNLDNQVRVVNDGGDGILTVEIVDVQRRTVRETKEDRPASVVLSITTKCSLYDEVEQKYIVKDLALSSSHVSAMAGLYEVDRGQIRSSAEETATEMLAKEIVRQTLGAW